MTDKNFHLYEMTCWNINNKWYVNDIKNLSGKSGKWFTPMRILDLSIDEYINILIKYKAKHLSYFEETDFLFFYFNSEKDAKAFCSYINKEAKKKKYFCK